MKCAVRDVSINKKSDAWEFILNVIIQIQHKEKKPLHLAFLLKATRGCWHNRFCMKRLDHSFLQLSCCHLMYQTVLFNRRFWQFYKKKTRKINNDS